MDKVKNMHDYYQKIKDKINNNKSLTKSDRIFWLMYKAFLQDISVSYVDLNKICFRYGSVFQRLRDRYGISTPHEIIGNDYYYRLEI
jgi:hypothetical protein